MPRTRLPFQDWANWCWSTAKPGWGAIPQLVKQSRLPQSAWSNSAWPKQPRTRFWALRSKNDHQFTMVSGRRSFLRLFYFPRDRRTNARFWFVLLFGKGGGLWFGVNQRHALAEVLDEAFHSTFEPEHTVARSFLQSSNVGPTIMLDAVTCNDCPCSVAPVLTVDEDGSREGFH